MLQILLKTGIDVNVRNLWGRTTLYWSAQLGDETAVLTLLETGAAVQIGSDFGAPLEAAPRQPAVGDIQGEGVYLQIGFPYPLCWSCLPNSCSEIFASSFITCRSQPPPTSSSRHHQTVRIPPSCFSPPPRIRPNSSTSNTPPIWMMCSGCRVSWIT